MTGILLTLLVFAGSEVNRGDLPSHRSSRFKAAPSPAYEPPRTRTLNGLECRVDAIPSFDGILRFRGNDRRTESNRRATNLIQIGNEATEATEAHQAYKVSDVVARGGRNRETCQC